MRQFGLGDDHQPTCVFIEPMNNTGPLYATDTSERLTAMRDQRIDQRPVGIARRGMNHQSRRLVDHEHMLVFVGNNERHRLRHRLVWYGIWQSDYEALTTPRLCRWIGRRSAGGTYLPRHDQALGLRPRHGRQGAGQETVEPFALVDTRYGYVAGLAHGNRTD